MKWLDRVWPPTLVRRVSLTLLLAFALIWVVQLGLIFLQSKDQASVDQNLGRRAETLLKTLATVDRADQACVVMQTAHNLFNQNFDLKLSPNQAGVQLLDAQGRLVYGSPALGLQPLVATQPELGERQVGGLRWRVVQKSSERWTVWAAETPWENAWLLQTINQRMMPYVVLSFFLILLPLAWAVSRGLRPLKALSRTIAQRSADDLSPLHFYSPYQELSPLGQALERLLSGLRSKIEREHAFVHDAAHELRTPLAAVGLHAHALSKADGVPDRLQAGQGLQQALQRASHLIDQLLALAQLDSDRANTNLIALDLAQCVRQEVALVLPAAMQSDIDLQVMLPDHFTCRLEADAFRAIVQNLLTNAIRYVQPRGHILVELIAPNPVGAPTSVVLRVRDDGPGIAPDQHALVFERFHRGVHPGITGSGLGLAIVKQATVRLQASVSLSVGLDGAGLGVTVTLPVQ